MSRQYSRLGDLPSQNDGKKKMTGPVWKTAERDSSAQSKPQLYENDRPTDTGGFEEPFAIIKKWFYKIKPNGFFPIWILISASILKSIILKLD